MREVSARAARPGSHGLPYAQPLRMIEYCPTPMLVNMVRQMIDMAQQRVYITSASLIPHRAARSTTLRRSLHMALDRKVRLLMLDDMESLEEPTRRSLLNELLRRGAEIRISPHAPRGLLIVDGIAAVACDNPVSNMADCTQTRSKAVITLLQQFADIAWRTSLGLEASTTVNQGARLDVLHHLCSGHKDEVSARLLNMSLRTYRRHVADLLKMLGASSRFEAGARAVMLGLIN